MPELQLLWGCEPARQFETDWLHWLLANQPVHDSASGWLGEPLAALGSRRRILVESGLLRLERHPDPARLAGQRDARARRLEALDALGTFALVHLSDEEGFDGDELYPMLPGGTPIWRNFGHSRFAGLEPCPVVFPIGPRGLFLQPGPWSPASRRPLPWAFMGTLWGSGSRRLATALFLRALPQGFFHGASGFASGLPLHHYKQVLAQSVFALCPEGDRHLDTFRLYESLQMGCIPLVVDVDHQAQALLGDRWPLPPLASWGEALAFAVSTLQSPNALNALQDQTQRWWQQRYKLLSTALSTV